MATQKEMNEGSTPLHIAAVTGDTEVVLKMIMEKADLSVVDNYDQSPLGLAVQFDQEGVLDLLLNARVSPCVQNNEGRTPLHMAACFGHTGVAKRLLKAEASFTVKDMHGQTPLHIAAMNDMTEVVDLLLKKGATQSVKDGQGWTPLHWTAKTCKIKVLEILLKNNPPLNAVDNKGWTPLHCAAGAGDAKVVNLMLRAGACLFAKNKKGLTPRRIAEKCGNTEVQDLLFKAKVVADNEEYMDNTDEIVAQFSMNGTSDERKGLWSKGIFKAYENFVYLGGDCNVGKSTLASILIGEEIPQHWKSTDGLNIYFGRNGIHVTDKAMVPLKQATIQEDIKQEIENGTYKIEIAPSYLAGFGGQMFFGMTSQLLMQHKGTFVLMLNARIDLSVPLDEDKKGGATECTKTLPQCHKSEQHHSAILKHCVNFILSYWEDDGDTLPIIMFSAIHSDDFNQEDHNIKKDKLIRYLGEIFKNHERKDHIIYDEIFFINGQDKSDPDINKLKTKLVEVACNQKSWGRPMPMACVPLDLHMSELRLNNMNIISKEELITLNQRNGDLKLTVEQIKYFLNVQHSLGKILYFDQQGLDHFIIVHPQSLVNILSSFITVKHIWPEEKELKDILCTLTNTGKIAKQDLLKLWSQKKFHQYMPNDDFKEFIIQVLVHLDILVEPKQESKVQSYFVPRIVTDFYVKSADRMICLSYTLLKSSIPAGLFPMLIGAAVMCWPLQEKVESICLHHQAAILCIDESNELHLLVEDDKVLVYLINKTTKSFIPPNIASAVQECITLTMKTLLKTLSISKELEIEVGEWCTSGGGCYISDRKVKQRGEWICKNKMKHDKKFPLYWIFDKNQLVCDKNCSGLDEKDLALHPEDKHLFRLARLIPADEWSKLVIKLGLICTISNDIQDVHGNDITVRKFLTLHEYKHPRDNQMSGPSFKELSEALTEDHHSHLLCRVFMEDVKVYDFANYKLSQIPDDDALYLLSRTAGHCAMHLGVELGLSVATIMQICKINSMVDQTFCIMKKWKSSSKVRTTILMLTKAFQYVDVEGFTFLRETYG